MMSEAKFYYRFGENGLRVVLPIESQQWRTRLGCYAVIAEYGAKYNLPMRNPDRVAVGLPTDNLLFPRTPFVAAICIDARWLEPSLNIDTSFRVTDSLTGRVDLQPPNDGIELALGRGWTDLLRTEYPTIGPRTHVEYTRRDEVYYVEPREMSLDLDDPSSVALTPPKRINLEWKRFARNAFEAERSPRPPVAYVPELNWLMIRREAW